MLRAGSRLNLYQCKMLAANGFLSKHHDKDYSHEEVIDRMWELQARKDEKNIKALMKHLNLIPEDELPPPIPAEADEGLEAEYDWMKL